MSLLFLGMTLNVEIGLSTQQQYNEESKKYGSGDYQQLIYISSPGLRDPNYIQPTLPQGLTEEEEQEEENVQEKKATELESDNLNDQTKSKETPYQQNEVKKGSSNFRNIRPKQGTIYEDNFKESEENEDDEYKENAGEDEIVDEGYEGDEDEDDEEYDDEDYDKDEYEAAYQNQNEVDEEVADGNKAKKSDISDPQSGNYKEEREPKVNNHVSNDLTREKNRNIPVDVLDPLILEKSDPELDDDALKFKEKELKAKSESLINNEKKSIDSKFLKDLLDTPISKSKSFHSKQEQHSPYTFTGRKLSHSKPFRSFKEFISENAKKIKLVSTASKESNEPNDFPDDVGFAGQRVAENAPPTDPSRYNNEGTFEEDIVKGIPRKIKSQIVRLPHNVNEELHKIKGKVKSKII